MEDFGGRVKAEAEIKAKDNASKEIDKVTKSLERMGTKTSTVDDLLKNLSKNAEAYAKTIKESFKSIDTKTLKKIDVISKAAARPAVSSQKRASANLQNERAKEINAKTDAGYYDALVAEKMSQVAHAGDRLQVELTKLEETVNLVTVSENKKLAAELRAQASADNRRVTEIREPDILARAKFKYSPEFYEEIRSRNRYRDARTDKLLMEGGDKIGLKSIGGILAGAKEPTGVVSAVGKSLQFAAKAIVNPSVALQDGLIKAGKAAMEFANQSIQAYENIQVIRTNLGVISGTQAEGDRLFGDISQYAIKSPFGVQQTAEQATLLKQSGVYAVDLMDTLKMVGDLAGGNEDKMRRISNDYAQIVANGKANMLQLRQFGNAGIPIYKELSKELGVSSATVRKMSRDGEITAEAVEKVLKNLTSEGGVFYESVEKGAKTLKARTTNLEDIKTLAKSEVGESIVNLGRNDEGISILNKMLTIQENFFQWMYTKIGRVNDNSDYKKLLDNEKEIAKIRSKLEKTYDLKDRNELYIKLDRLLNAFTDDERESIRYNRYKSSREDVNNLGLSNEQLEETIKTITGAILQAEANGDFGRADYLRAELNMEKSLKQSNTYRADAIENSISTDQRQAAFGVYYKQTQTNAEESLEKLNKKTGSLSDITDKMLNAYKQTQEYKDKEAEEQKKAFEQTKRIATELKSYVDKNGIVDLAKITDIKTFDKYKELLSVESRFVLNPDKYEGVQGKYEAIEENKDFQSNLRAAIALIQTADITNKAKNTDYKELLGLLKHLQSLSFITDAEEFAKAFDTYFEKLEKLSNGNMNQRNVAEQFKSYVNPLLSGRLVGNTAASTINNLDDGKSIDPLWARILGSGLGLDSGFVKKAGGAATLKTHEEQQYSRNITKSLLSAGAKNGMNAYALMGMVKKLPDRPENYKADKDGSKKLQIDWKNTRKVFKEFALELGQASNVTSAYREVVESEVNTLADLLASMPTTFEEAANSKDFMDQFLNVFTGEMKLNGDTVHYDAATKMITDSNGNVISAIYDVIDQIDFAEGSMRELTKQLSDRRNDLIEAKKAESTNDIFGAGAAEFRESAYSFIAKAIFGYVDNSSQAKDFISESKINDTAKKWESYSDWTDPEKAAVKKAEEEDKKNLAIKENAGKEIQSLTEQKKILEEKLQVMNAYNDAVNKAAIAWGNLPENKNAPKQWNLLSPEQQKSQSDYVNNDAGFREAYNKKASLNISGTVADLNASIKDLDNEINGLKSLINNLVTNSAADVKEQQFKVKNRENSTNIEDVYAVASKYVQKEALESQDQDALKLSKLIENVDLLVATNLNKPVEREDYFKEKFYKDAYGLSSSQFESFTEGKSKQVEVLLKTKGQEGAEELNEILGGDGGTQLLELLNGNQIGTEAWDKLIEKLSKVQLVGEQAKGVFKNLKDSLSSSFDSFALDTINSTFTTLGESIYEVTSGLGDGANAWDAFGKGFVNSVKSLTANMGELMMTAGLKLLITGGMGMLGPAMALIGAGGFASLVSGLMNVDDKKDTKNSELEKLNKLKDDLKDLLAQAKADAIYYEQNVNNRKALTAVAKTQSVNDAIITPSGNVISTHPDDYLIATKTPDTLMNGRGNSAPVVNLNIVNNSGQKLNVEQTTTTKDGQINIEAVIEGIVNKGLATGSFDNAMKARETRLSGNRVYM